MYLQLLMFRCITYRITNSYPFPTFLNKPEGFEWTDMTLNLLKIHFHLSTSAVAFNDMEFLRDYTDRYFEFVLDNEGGVSVKGFDY